MFLQFTIILFVTEGHRVTLMIVADSFDVSKLEIRYNYIGVMGLRPDILL